VAYIDHFGVESVRDIAGMFAFMGLNHDNGDVIWSRDRFGIKPLFVSNDGEGIVVASDSLSVLHLRSCATELDVDYLKRLILADPFVGFDPRLSLFTGVESVEPGTYTIAPRGDFKKRIIKRYYSFPDLRDTVPVERESILDQIREVFRRVVREHLEADVPIAIALSGGLDSTLLGLLAAECAVKVTYFTINVTGDDVSFGDDARVAERVFQHLSSSNSKFRVIDIGSDWNLETIDRCVTALGSPLYDERAIVWDKMYRAAELAEVKVVLNGQGADELWHGYYPKIWSWFSCLYHERPSYESVQAYFGRRQKESAIGSLLRADIQGGISNVARNVWEEIDQCECAFDHPTALGRFMVRHVLASLLSFEDAFSMAHGVEVRVPFVDHRLADIALALPAKMHIGDGDRGKELLRDAFGSILPREVVIRKKAPLPKPSPSDDSLASLFVRYRRDIERSPLVRELYDRRRFDDLAAHASDGFYGSTAEAHLQLLSTWRFENIVNI
jgi:asparagine synthase (glutamine-hydrolysing)